MSDSGDQRRGPGGKRKSGLSEDDRALWDHVARSVTKPGSANKARIPKAPERGPPHNDHQPIAQLEEQLRSEASTIPPLAAPYKPNHRSQQTRPPPLAHPTGHKSPPLADFDRKAVRRIRSGRIEIEARIDLHGMRQDEAHSSLRAFLRSSQARGLRWVLVITGKGSRDTTQEDYDLSMPIHHRSDRGVLRRSVPRWLAEPELRSLVVSYTTSALHHGGEGALYIQLRMKRLHGHR
ncbi:MAG: Smr/MutS family protein [Hyphomicrobiaceae bacterium]